MRLQAARGHPLATGTAHLHGVRVAQGGRARERSWAVLRLVAVVVTPYHIKGGTHRLSRKEGEDDS